MTMTSANPTDLFGSEVLDGTGTKIGTVDNVWVDDATDQLEFIGVKTGWLFGKTHVIPAEQAQVANGQVTVPYPEEQIKEAPSFAGDAQLSPDEESQIYSYYGMQRSTAPSPTGMGTETPPSSPPPRQTEGDTRMQLSEESLQVGKREVAAGQVRLRKVVKTERQEVPVDLRREEIQVERVPAQGDTVPENAFTEQEVTMTATREEPVVAKEAHVTDEVRIGKDVQTEQQTVSGETRHEEVDVQRDAGTDTTGS